MDLHPFQVVSKDKAVLLVYYVLSDMSVMLGTWYEFKEAVLQK